MAPLRIVLLLVVSGLIVAGCRDLVEPGRVELVRNYRVVEGRIEGDEGVPYAARSVRFDSRDYGDTTIAMGVWILPVGEDGTFRTTVPRGWDGRADVTLRWSIGDGRMQQYPIPGFDLGTKTWVFEVATRRMRGQVTAPAGYDEAVLEDSDFTLARVSSFGGFGGTALWYIDLDDAGRFDAIVPHMDVIPRLVYDSPDLDRDLDVWWPDADLDEELALDLALQQVWIRVRAPEDYPLESTPRMQTRRGDFYGNRARTYSSVEPGGRAQRVWVTDPVDAIQWSLDHPSGVSPHAFWPSALSDTLETSVPTDTLEFSVGDAMLTVDVTEDGEPAAGVHLQVETMLGAFGVATSSSGRADFAVPFGPAYIRASSPGATISRWVDVAESRSVLLDLTRGTLDEGP